MRSTSARSSDRFVMTAQVCGRPVIPAKVAPPLKSISARFSVSDECITASAGHQRPQQLALAGAGRADDQAVRAHAALGRLLEVQVHRPALRVDAQRDPQPVAGRARRPRHGRCRCRAGRRCRAARPARTSTTSASRRRRRRGCATASASGPAPRRRRGRGRPGGRGTRAAARWRRRRPCRASRGAVCRLSSRSVENVRGCSCPTSITVTPSRPSSPISRGSPWALPPSTTTIRCGRSSSAAGAAAERGAFAEVGAEQLGQPGRRVGGQPARPRRRRSRRAAVACGSHFAHSQSCCRSAGTHSATRRSAGEWKVTSWHSSARVRPSTSGRRPATVTAANERSDSATGRPVDRGVGADEVLEAGGGHRVQVLQRHGLRRLQRRRQPLRAGARADLRELPVGAPPVPQLPGLDVGPEVGGVGLDGDHRRALAVGDVPDLGPQPGEVPLVVAALVVDLRLLRHPAAAQRHHDHAAHRADEQRAEDVGHHAAVASDVDERHRAHAEHHRQEHHQLHHAAGRALRAASAATAARSRQVARA